YPYNRSEQTLQKLVADCWSLSDVAAGYHEFIVSFRPLMALLREVDPAALTPLRCFQIKLLLIHFFRRVVLKDPLLPD
ncbi:PaaX family transcriptional regulator C-terminal domain-containing protein, partial [Escherichia coli]